MKKASSHNRLLHVESAGGIPVVTITGTPRSMGHSLGERLRPRIAVLIQDIVQELATVSGDDDLLDDNGGIRQERTVDWLHELLGGCQDRMRRADPTLWMELESMAEICDIDVIFLLAIHAYNDLLHRFARDNAYFESDCLSLQGGHSVIGAPLLAMDWSIPPYLLPHLLLIRRIPAHGPATIMLSLGGLHTVAGISASGVAFSSNGLRDVFLEEEGLPSTCAAQLALTASTYDDAVARLERQRYLGGRCMHLLGPNQQRLSLEMAGEHCFALPAPFAEAPRIHTNHRLHAGAPADGSTPIRRSQQRLQRLARRIARSNPDTSLEEIDRWFLDDDEQERTRRHTASRVRPVSAAIIVLDPAHQLVHCHGGGAPAALKQVGL